MKHHWIEFELSHLAKLIAMLDEQLSQILPSSMEPSDGESFGLFDSAEHTAGLGFAACQTYMATAYGNLGVSKPRALELGPRHKGGLTKAQVINHAANYWKHNNEWPLDRKEVRRKKIEEAFKTVGFPLGTDYPLNGILTELSNPEPASFRALLVILEEWKRELYGAA